jgi:hypothetical protein
MERTVYSRENLEGISLTSRELFLRTIYDMIFLYSSQEFLDLCSCPLSGVSFPIVIAPPSVSSPLPHPLL